MSKRLTVLAAVAVLAGCSLNPLQGSKVYTATPKIGECWQATNQQASDWLDWQGFEPVSCNEEHTLETVGVPTVEGDFPGTGLGGTDEYSEEFKVAAGQQCASSWEKIAENRKKPNRLLNFLFYPTPEQFADGYRWVRCDVGVYDIGTAWTPSDFQLQSLTKPIRSITPASAFQLCLDSASDSFGESGANLQVADCGLPHRWTMVRAKELAVSANEKYPGPDEVDKRARLSCSAKKPQDITGWFWQSPSKAQWAAGNSTSYCWWANNAEITTQALAKSITPEG